MSSNKLHKKSAVKPSRLVEPADEAVESATGSQQLDAPQAPEQKPPTLQQLEDAKTNIMLRQVYQYTQEKRALCDELEKINDDWVRHKIAMNQLDTARVNLNMRLNDVNENLRQLKTKLFGE